MENSVSVVGPKEGRMHGTGGSGCGCSATMLSAYVLENLKAGEWKRVFFVPAGVLLGKLRREEGFYIVFQDAFLTR